MLEVRDDVAVAVCDSGLCRQSQGKWQKRAATGDPNGGRIDLGFAEILADCALHFNGIADADVGRRVVAIEYEDSFGSGQVAVRNVLHVKTAQVAQIIGIVFLGLAVLYFVVFVGLLGFGLFAASGR